MVSTRDKNLVKIAVLLPTSAFVIGSTLRFFVGSWLSVVGAVTVAYLAAHVLRSLRGVRAHRRSRAYWVRREAAFLAADCRGWALVTGCTSGLGLAFARGLRERGCNLVMVSRSADKLAAVKKELEAEFPNGSKIETRAYDLSSPDRSFYDELRATKVGLVINNAGLGTEDPQRIDEISAADCDAMIAVNCAATTHVCRAVLPALSSLGGGVVVNISSGSAVQPSPFLAVYAATKAFIAHLSRSLDREWRPKGVRVLCAAPYYISNTGLFKSTKRSFNAPPAAVVVDGVLKTLASPYLTSLELTHTNKAHAFIAFLFSNISEDPVLAPIAAFLAARLNFNASSTQVMTKARARFLKASSAS